VGKGLERKMNIAAKLSYLNIFRKMFIFLKYCADNIANKEYSLIFTGLKYLLLKKSNSSDRVIKTNNGIFLIRKYTIDFKLANSAYEISVTKRFKKIIPAFDLFIDVGANIGTYSIIAGKRALSTIAFEPIETNYNSLVKNIELNQLEKFIIPYRFGLGEKAETSRFNFYPLKPGASGKNPLKKRGEQIEVQIENFDHLELPNIISATNILIKIDVEGMETEVLRGMQNLISQNKGMTLIIETKHSGEQSIKDLLNKYSTFQFEKIDEFNMLAKKV